MIKVFLEQIKDKCEIIAVASAQTDLNNLRLMSYALNDGKDKVQLNKDKYGGQYLRITCDEYKSAEGVFDIEKIQKRVQELQEMYS